VGRYEINIKPSAAKELERLGTKKERARIIAAIRALARDPRPSGCTKLAGTEGYRIRIGTYRIVYTIEDNRLTITVIKIGHRRDVYR
jgi:mRNA interferase RelE/StbE